MQLSLGGLGEIVPEGFSYVPRFVSPHEHDELLARIARLPFGEFRMRGVAARRRVVHFGWSYDPDRRDLRASEAGDVPAIPQFLLPLRDRCAALIDDEVSRLEEALATFYPPGAAIGWHRDAPQFGTVVGVSFGSPCRLRFRRDSSGEQLHAETVIEPGSAYVLAGAARWSWQHHIPALQAPRWSITFRSVRQQGPSSARRRTADGEPRARRAAPGRRG